LGVLPEARKSIVPHDFTLELRSGDLLLVNQACLVLGCQKSPFLGSLLALNHYVVDLWYFVREERLGWLFWFWLERLEWLGAILRLRLDG
jgi:hypothetical protein